MRYAIEESLIAENNELPEFSTGIRKYRTETYAERKHEAYRQQKEPVIPKVINTDKVSSSLRLALQVGTPFEVIPVVVGLHSPAQISVVNELDSAIGRGEIRSESDFVIKRQAILTRRSKEILALQEKFINSISTKATCYGVTNICQPWSF